MAFLHCWKRLLHVAKKYARIPRHICKEFVFSCPSCSLRRDRNVSILTINEDGTPRRPLKRKAFSPVTPIRVARMSKVSKVSLQDFKVKGLIAAPFTPFEENGDLKTKSIAPYVKDLLQDGVDSVFVLGTTSEGPSLTLRERKAVASEWVKCGKGKLDHVIVQVGAGNLKDTQDLAMHASSIGASAVAVLPPVFFKPQTPEHLVNYLKQVGDVVPTLPLYYYHYPKMTGVDFTMMDILRALESDPIPNFKGAKFVSADLTDFSLSVNVSKDKYQMIFSLEGMELPSMTLGATAFVGSIFSFAGKVVTRLIEAYESGDLERARAEQFRIHAFLDVMNRYEKIAGFATLKYTMTLAKFDVGPPRPPLSQMSPEDIEALRKDLTEIGFFDWIN
ncbi:N-acetylneuraminate lyase-like isoform X2 [Acanthaster planci]|uniref:N-acetylneuraminate lyase n=1 Tax=Acanthaster planci TaxID=133434 RepID=A0A8B7ZJU3_ACAPL|nr:N-acetylneuraminate lyase-like isoform X2 [Acanthaster planci]